MDEHKLSEWTEIADRITKSEGGDSKSTIPLKYEGLCNILTEIYKELGTIIDVCLNEIQSPNRKQMRIDRYIDDINHLWHNRDLRDIFDLLQHHLSEIEEYEHDDEIKECERHELLVEYKNITRIENIGSNETHPDSIYCTHGLYRRYCELRNSDDYKVCRKILNLNSRGEDIRTIFKAIYLYLSILNEKRFVEKLARSLGITLQESITNAIENAHNGFKKQDGVDVPLELENSAEERLGLFLGYVPPKNKDKAKKLLRRVIEAGYCDTKYYWDASKWRKGKSRLALASFCYLASDYLGLSEKSNANGDDTTNWQPFEILFDYDGKSNSKNPLMATKKYYMKSWSKFEPPELKEIKTNIFDKLQNPM